MAERKHRLKNNGSNIQRIRADGGSKGLQKTAGDQRPRYMKIVCETQRKAVQYPLTGCNKLAGKEYIRQHRNALMVLAVQWSVQEGILPKETKWFKERCEKQKIIENNEEEIYSDREHQMRANCTSIRPGLTLEDKEKKIEYLVHMSCPIELSKATKGDEKIQKYQQLVFDIREQ